MTEAEFTTSVKFDPETNTLTPQIAYNVLTVLGVVSGISEGVIKVAVAANQENTSVRKADFRHDILPGLVSVELIQENEEKYSLTAQGHEFLKSQQPKS